MEDLVLEGMKDVEIISMMHSIVLSMESNYVEHFPITLENIKLTPGINPQFKIKGIKQYKNNPARTHTEVEKIEPLCNLMLEILLLNKEGLSENIIECVADLDIVEDLRKLLFKCINPNSLITLKFFINRIKEFYEKTLYLMQEVEEGNSLIISTCDYCKLKTLEPILEIKECGCVFHVECFEECILDSISLKEFDVAPNITVECSRPEMHLHMNDLKIISELDNQRHYMKPSIRKLLKYYYHNTNTSVECTIDCPEDHRKVSLFTKKPERLCNNKCSFCANKFHNPCPFFIESLRYSD